MEQRRWFKQSPRRHLFRFVCWCWSGKLNSIQNVHISEISARPLPNASAAMDRTKHRKPPLQISVNKCQAHLVYRVQNIETDICKVRSGKSALNCTRSLTTYRCNNRCHQCVYWDILDVTCTIHAMFQIMKLFRIRYFMNDHLKWTLLIKFFFFLLSNIDSWKALQCISRGRSLHIL